MLSLFQIGQISSHHSKQRQNRDRAVQEFCVAETLKQASLIEQISHSYACNCMTTCVCIYIYCNDCTDIYIYNPVIAFRRILLLVSFSPPSFHFLTCISTSQEIGALASKLSLAISHALKVLAQEKVKTADGQSVRLYVCLCLYLPMMDVGRDRERER